MRESHTTAGWHAVVDLLLRDTDNFAKTQADRAFTQRTRSTIRRASLAIAALTTAGCAGPDAVDALAIAAIFAPLAGAWVLVRCRG